VLIFSILKSRVRFWPEIDDIAGEQFNSFSSARKSTKRLKTLTKIENKNYYQPCVAHFNI